LLILLWRVYVNTYLPYIFDFIVPFLLTLIVVVILHVLISLLLPMRWATIRGEFRRRLEERLVHSMREAFLSIPGDVAEELRQERKHMEALRGDVAKVSEWLDERQHTANIAGLYGSEHD
jgi:hypothetical protein